jgi:hypothetical protein
VDRAEPEIAALHRGPVKGSVMNVRHLPAAGAADSFNASTAIIEAELF